MPQNSTPVTGDGPPVSELGPEAAGELAALNGTAHALTAEPGGEPSGEQVVADLADPDVLTLGVREPAGGEQLIAAGSVRVDPVDPGVADVAHLVVEPAAGAVGWAGRCCARSSSGCRARSRSCACRWHPRTCSACGSTPDTAFGRPTASRRQAATRCTWSNAAAAGALQPGYAGEPLPAAAGRQLVSWAVPVQADGRGVVASVGAYKRTVAGVSGAR